MKQNKTQVSLNKNIIASYFSQAYVVLLGILVLPFYVIEMGGAHGWAFFLSATDIVQSAKYRINVFYGTQIDALTK